MLVVKIVGLQTNKEINRFGLKAEKDANTQIGDNHCSIRTYLDLKTRDF